MALPEVFDGTLFDGGPLPADFPSSFAIITAWATTGETWTDERNAAADAALQAELSRRGLAHHRITGWAPVDGDGVHAEPGWAVVCDRQEAVALGIQFEQRAVFFIEDDRLSILSCVPGEGDRVLAGGFRARRRTRS